MAISTTMTTERWHVTIEGKELSILDIKGLLFSGDKWTLTEEESKWYVLQLEERRCMMAGWNSQHSPHDEFILGLIEEICDVRIANGIPL